MGALTQGAARHQPSQPRMRSRQPRHVVHARPVSPIQPSVRVAIATDAGPGGLRSPLAGRDGVVQGARAQRLEEATPRAAIIPWITVVKHEHPPTGDCRHVRPGHVPQRGSQPNARIPHKQYGAGGALLLAHGMLRRNDLLLREPVGLPKWPPWIISANVTVPNHIIGPRAVCSRQAVQPSHGCSRRVSGIGRLQPRAPCTGPSNRDGRVGRMSRRLR